MTELPAGYIRVLDDKGYVGLKDHMGTDLSTTRAARVSYNKDSEEWNGKEERLLNFLIREGHTSTLRHATLSFEVYAPMMVKNQWIKHAIGSSHLEDGLAWNESSRRYVTEEPEFYVPAGTDWRSKPANSKQGSGGVLLESMGGVFTEDLHQTITLSVKLYEEAMANGVAPEQARLFLPAYAMYIRWIWTTSLAGVLSFLEQRLASDSQFEIQEFAKAVEIITADKFPNTVKVWKDHR